MKPIATFIESGLLELYAMGAASEADATSVEEMVAAHAEVREELRAIEIALQAYAIAQGKSPSPKVKPLVLATVDYIIRMQDGEELVNPPELTPATTLTDYAEWLNREDMTAPDDFDDIFVKIIGFNLRSTTAILWIKNMPYSEVHENEHERFLIVEGTCDLHVGDEVYPLKKGDFFQVPLHIPHTFKITSEVPCKTILQRLAA